MFLNNGIFHRSLPCLHRLLFCLFLALLLSVHGERNSRAWVGILPEWIGLAIKHLFIFVTTQYNCPALPWLNVWKANLPPQLRSSCSGCYLCLEASSITPLKITMLAAYVDKQQILQHFFMDCNISDGWQLKPLSSKKDSYQFKYYKHYV